MLPEYQSSAYKLFIEGERHITRVFDQHVLIVMLDGTLCFREDGQDITLSAGQYYVQRSGLLQEGTAACGGARYYYIHFCGDIPCEISGYGDFSALVPLFDRLEFLSLTGADVFSKTTVFYQIVESLRGIRLKASDTVTRVLRAVTGDMSHKFTLSELATISGYSKNQLINVFKREVGQSPLAFISDIRFRAAGERLLYSDLPIGVIAQNTGYGDYINLYKEFVKRKGITPTEYRKRHR